MGSNIERYAVLLAGPLLLCAIAARNRSAGGTEPVAGSGNAGAGRAGPRARGAVLRAGGTAAVAVALCLSAVWVLWGPVRETLAVAGNESTQASYYVPVERFLAHVAPGPAPAVRVEVPLTRSHWEAALLAPSVSLARGWEKQLDTRFDHVLLTPGLSAAAYEGWLHEQAVSYVALPDTPLDPSSAGEGRLIRGGLPYLREVFASRHWTIYAVLGSTPLAAGPGRLSALGSDSFVLRARSAGRFLVRVHFTRYWTVTSGSACVTGAPRDWTDVNVLEHLDLTAPAWWYLNSAVISGTCVAK